MKLNYWTLLVNGGELPDRWWCSQFSGVKAKMQWVCECLTCPAAGAQTKPDRQSLDTVFALSPAALCIRTDVNIHMYITHLCHLLLLQSKTEYIWPSAGAQLLPNYTESCVCFLHRKWEKLASLRTFALWWTQLRVCGRMFYTKGTCEFEWK